MCSVVGCDSERHGAQRFRLPEDPERRLEWVQFLLEVNGQRLKESCWTDITICRNHFKGDSFINLTPSGTVQLKSGAVPSLCVKSEPDEPEPREEPEETTEVASQYDKLKRCDSPSSCSEESGLTSATARESPVPSDDPDAFMSDYGQMLQKVVNIDMIREKAALLQMKGKYVLKEKRLLQLFRHKCPSCGSKVKMEKVTYGVLIILNQQCLQCDYRNQWKSQVNASVPTAENKHLTEVVEVTPQTQQMMSTDDNCSSITDMSEMAPVVDDESDPIDETEESGDEGDTDSDENWHPEEDLSMVNEIYDESEEETEDEEDEEEDGYHPPLPAKHSRLCTECGVLYNKQKPHTCEYKIKPYSCNICGKRCVNEIALSSHSRIHAENYEYRCKYCRATFKTKVDKITHEQIHVTQGKPYKCPDCPESFATNKERRIHLEDHRGPQQLKCHICGIDFTQQGFLQRHLAVHTGEKPFKCSVCQRGFKQAGHLKSHMRLHTGERPYKCQLCDKSFNHNVSLKSHVQRYHSPGSGRERKKGRRNKTVVAQEDGNNRGSDTGLSGKEEEVLKDRKVLPKRKRRSTGRPKGRPKRDSAGNLGEKQGRRSNTKTAEAQEHKSKRTRRSDEEREGEPTQSGMIFDPTEEKEGNSEEVTSNTSRSRRRRTKHCNGDPDFDPEKKRK
ncbi:zinc finger and SCAN domain-containing protein 12-like isoform X2 [Anoplopoma fimbria]|uniref:zinc finger and SCAN domain-containing protein 12-like isoform X2 n=1 Tax=Anoplopoma fimbria TaxID=229290 RepID=UPI0023ED2B29|nr:zinc finger and SCAN domain-containing protein 12-like isoform X2 [Anoplopoma fimbria]